MSADTAGGNDELEAFVVLTGVAEEEEGLFVSYCGELGTSSCGNRTSEALKDPEEAIDLHLNALQQVGELKGVFREKGAPILDQPGPAGPVNAGVPLGIIIKTYSPTLDAA